MCLLNDIPVFATNSTEPYPGSRIRAKGDTIFRYGLDGTFIKEISIKPIYDELDSVSTINLFMCDSTDVYFLITGYAYEDPNSPTLATDRTITLCRANFDTGEVTQIYKLA